MKEEELEKINKKLDAILKSLGNLTYCEGCKKIYTEQDSKEHKWCNYGNDL